MTSRLGPGKWIFFYSATFQPHILGYTDAAQPERQSSDAVTELVLAVVFIDPTGIGTTSKRTKDAENVYAPLVMVSRKRTLAGKTVYQNRSIDTSFDPP